MPADFGRLFQYVSSEPSGCERLGVVQGRDSRLIFVRCCSPQFFAPSGAAIDGSSSSYQSLAPSWVGFPILVFLCGLSVVSFDLSTCKKVILAVYY